MQIYNNQNNSTTRSTRNCSYCGKSDHVVTDCPNAVNDWAYFQRYEIPLKQTKHWTLNGGRTYNGQVFDHWYRSPREWGKWFLECEKAIKKIEKAQAKAKLKQSGKRSPSKCGFCGSIDHNRRHCPAMEQFKRRLLQANQGWRQRFYDKLVGELGLSVGAIVNVKVSGGWNKPDEDKIGIVESINWDELSMFCYTLTEKGWRSSIRDEFKQPLKVLININGKTHTMKFNTNTKNAYGNQIFALQDSFGTLSDYTGWGRSDCMFHSTIARSDTPLDEEWVNQGHEDAMDFLIKKYSMEKLKSWNVDILLHNVEEANKARNLALSA